MFIIELFGLRYQDGHAFSRPLGTRGNTNLARRLMYAPMLQVVIKETWAWNCQEYVMDVLEAANLDDIIDDYKYGKIKDYLQGIINT